MSTEPDLGAALYVGLGRLVRSLRRESPDGGSHVGPGGLGVLVTLQAQGSMRLGELADHEGVKPASMTRIVQTLEAMGLVSRCPDPFDRRAQVLSITADGGTLITSGTEARIGALQRRIEALPPADQQRLSAALPALAALCALPV